jgi:hypothetical protein
MADDDDGGGSTTTVRVGVPKRPRRTDLAADRKLYEERRKLYIIRSARIRLVVGGVTVVIGIITFSVSGIFTFPIASVFRYLGAIGVLLGLFGPLMLNYLGLGIFLPTPKAIEEFLRTGSTEKAAATLSAEEPISPTIRRLNGEIADLGRRGNINLVIGILTTVVGVSILGYVVFYTSSADGEDFGWKSGVHTVLRVSIALFIQTFAYFFLRLYKTSLEDIKYYQNEITNIESKWLAFKAAMEAKNEALSKLAVDSLIKTERNFILKKGDTTMGLERERLEKNEIVDLVKDAIGVVAKIKPSSR